MGNNNFNADKTRTELLDLMGEAVGNGVRYGFDDIRCIECYGKAKGYLESLKTMNLITDEEAKTLSVSLENCEETYLKYYKGVAEQVGDELKPTYWKR